VLAMRRAKATAAPHLAQCACQLKDMWEMLEGTENKRTLVKWKSMKRTRGKY